MCYEWPALKSKGNYSHPKEGNCEGFYNGNGKWWRKYLFCQGLMSENRPCDFSVVTVNPADCGQTQTSEN